MLSMAKRRWRAGRTRKDGVQRYPGGKVKPANDKGTPELLSRRMDAGVSKANAEKEDAAWLCGRLFLAGAITAGQKEAALIWYSRTLAYKGLLCGPPPVSSVMFREPAGARPDDADAFERAKNNFDACREAIWACGWRVYAATEAAVFDEKRTDVSLVGIGLESLRKALVLPEE